MNNTYAIRATACDRLNNLRKESRRHCDLRAAGNARRSAGLLGCGGSVAVFSALVALLPSSPSNLRQTEGVSK